MLPLGPTHDSGPLGHAWAGLTEKKKEASENNDYAKSKH